MKYFNIIEKQGNIQTGSIDREKSVCIFAINTGLQIFIWDNFKSENKQSFDYVYNNMKGRVDKKFGNKYFDCEVYDWQKKELKFYLEGVYFNNRLCTKENALAKVWIGLPSGINNETYYNFENELYLPVNEICNRMYKRILVEKFKFKFTTAKFYTRHNANNEFTEIKKIEGNFLKQYYAVG